MEKQQQSESLESVPAAALSDVLQLGMALFRPTAEGTDYTLIELNSTLAEYDALVPEQSIGRRLSELYPNEVAESLLDVMARVFKSGIDEDLPALPHLSPSKYGWRKNRVHRLDEQTLLVLYLDTTPEQHRINTLQASEQSFRLLTESSLDGIWDWNLPKKRLYLSPKWKQQLGYTNAELENSLETWTGHLHPDDFELVMNDLESYLAAPTGLWVNEFRLRTKSGEYCWFMSRGSAVLNEQGEVTRILGVHIDIDDLKRVELEKIRNEERFEALLKLSRVADSASEQELIQEAVELGVSLTRSQIGYLHYVNSDQESLELVTWSRKTLNHCEAVFEKHYPISAAGIWADCVRNRQSVVHNDYATTSGRKGLPEGHIHLVRHLSVPVIYKGDAKMVLGVGNKPTDYYPEDVQQLELFVEDLWKLVEKKRAEEQLKQAAAVFENTQEAVTITDTTPSIISVNRAFTEITGYQAHEVIGQNPSLLQSGRHSTEFYEQMWYELVFKGSWSGEIWNRKKSGQIFPEWLTISSIRDHEGRTTHYAAVFTDITLLKQSEQQLEHLAHYDPLTDLPNRVLLFSRIEHAVMRATRYEQQLAIIYIDLDNFKNVNDSLGHPVGDRLLQVVARRLQDRLREEDTISRIGGDEFVVLIEEFINESDLSEITHDLIGRVTRPVEIDGYQLSVGCSIGIAVYPRDGDSVIDLIKNADAAMYLAKESGRNSYRFYTPALTERAKQRLQIESELRRAIEDQEIIPYFQPIVRLEDGVVVGAEALARWFRNGTQLYGPGDFIPVAEDSGLIESLAHQVLHKACRFLSAMDLSPDRTFTLSVNLSQNQFHSPRLSQELAAVLDAYDLPASRFEFELTETVLMKDTDEALAQLESIKALGASIAIDDFGTGFSSLAYLTRFPIDKLKIDKSFINNFEVSGSSYEVVSTIEALAKNMSLETIAEGVERASQLVALKRLGCDYYQGYFFSKPVSGEAFLKLLDEQ